MSEFEWIVVVDRIEGDVAVLVADDDASSRDVPLSDLPDGCGEGDVLRVPVDSDGRPEWGRASTDRELKAERLSRLQAELDALKGRDPGGDIVM